MEDLCSLFPSSHLKLHSHLKLLDGVDDVESNLVKMPLKETNKNSSHL